MKLYEYVSTHAVRGACTCGKCIDAPENPKEKQPNGHTADLIFFKVANKGAEKELFMDLARTEFPHWFDGKEHSYLQTGGDMGDQGIALMTMGLGKLLGVWDLLTPKSIMPFLPPELKQQMAGQGMITLKA